MRAILLAVLVWLLAPASPSSEAILVTGSVSDLAGRPLEDTSVRVVAPEAESPQETETDVDGLFWLEAPGGATLRISKDGFLPEEVAVPDAEELAVSLVRAASLEVAVLAAQDDAPIAGAEVALFPALPGGAREEESEAPAYAAESDRRGRALFAAIEPGAWRAVIRADGFGEENLDRLFLEGGEHRAPVARLRPLLTVSGRVLDGSGRPVPEARVAPLIYDRTRHSMRLGEGTLTDEDGSYRLEIDRGKLRSGILARRSGFGAGYAPLDPDEGQRSALLDLILPGPAWVEGRVLDEAGVGVANTPLSVWLHVRYREDGQQRRGPRFGLDDLLATEEQKPAFETDGEGRFRIGPLPPSSLTVVAGGPGRWKAPRESVDLEAGELVDDLTIVLDAGHRLAGTIEDEGGEPIPGAELALTFFEASEGREKHEVEAEEDGRFEISGIPVAVAERLEVTAEGYAPRELHDVELDGKSLLIRLGPAGALAGSVYDAGTGEPVGAFALRLLPERRGDELLGAVSERMFSDSRGRYLYSGVAPGTYDVDVYAEDYLPQELEDIHVRPSEETPVPPVHLTKGESIEGVVLDLHEKLPVAGARVSVKPLDEGEPLPDKPRVIGSWWSESVETDAEGRFRRGGLRSGGYLLDVSLEEYARWREPVHLPEAIRHGPIEILLGRGGRVQASVRDAEGNPREGVTVSLHRLDVPALKIPHVGTPYSERTGPDGVALIERVPPGRYEATLHHFPLESDSTVEVREGRLSAIELREEGVVVSGTVTWRGEPVPSFHAGVSGRERLRGVFLGRTAGRVRGENGRFEIGPVPAGDWSLWVRAEVPDPADPSRKLSLQANVPLEVPEGRNRITRHVRLPEHRIQGRIVRSDTGEPVPRVRLVFRSLEARSDDSRSPLLDGSRTVTEGSVIYYIGSGPQPNVHPDNADERGRFDLYVSLPGPYEIEARIDRDRTGLEGWRLREPRRIFVPEEGHLSNLVVRLEPGSIVEGTVRGPEGRPVEGAQVRFLPSEALRNGSRDELFHAADRTTHLGLNHFARKNRRWQNLTDSQGRYRLEGLEASPGILVASHPDFAPNWETAVRPGEVPVRRDLRLERGGALEIRLPPSDPDGRIHLRRSDLPFEIVLTPTSNHGSYLRETLEGHWLLPHLPEGTWTIEARIGGRSLRRVAEVQTNQRITVDLMEDAP